MSDLSDKNFDRACDLIDSIIKERDALVKVLERSRAQHHDDGMWETHPLLVEIDRVLADVGPAGERS